MVLNECRNGFLCCWCTAWQEVQPDFFFAVFVLGQPVSKIHSSSLAGERGRTKGEKYGLVRCCGNRQPRHVAAATSQKYLVELFG